MTQAHRNGGAERSVADMLADAQLSCAEVALELDVDEAAVRRWADGTTLPSRLALRALHSLAIQRGPDADAISAACRMAALQARTDAAKFTDPLVSERLLGLAESYERIAREFDGQRDAIGVRTTIGLDLSI